MQVVFSNKYLDNATHGQREIKRSSFTCFTFCTYGSAMFLNNSFYKCQANTRALKIAAGMKALKSAE